MSNKTHLSEYYEQFQGMQQGKEQQGEEKRDTNNFIDRMSTYHSTLTCFETKGHEGKQSN